MHRVSLDDLELATAGLEDEESARWLAAFPFTPGRPGATEAASGSLSVVYNELEPGTRLGTHRDGTDEALVILEGTVEVRVGEETDAARAGDLLLIPAETPHSVRNVGNGTARMLGCFGEGTVESAFEGTVVPVEPD